MPLVALVNYQWHFLFLILSVLTKARVHYARDIEYPLDPSSARVERVFNIASTKTMAGIASSVGCPCVLARGRNLPAGRAAGRAERMCLSTAVADALRCCTLQTEFAVSTQNRKKNSSREAGREPCVLAEG